MMTLRGFLDWATRTAVRPSGPADRWRQDVWALGCHVLGCSLAALLAMADGVPLEATKERAWRGLVDRRAAGEPLPYLVGQSEFWSLPLYITPDVLVPRPETEILVERVLASAPRPGACCADLGTGSGAVALAIKKECPDIQVVAGDRSLQALRVAGRNAQALALDIRLYAGSWLAALPSRSCDIIASNPPYIESADPCLKTDGLSYEPRGALDGGHDGLDAIRAIVTDAVRALRNGGRLLIEHGAGQGARVRALMTGSGLVDVATYPDYAGHPRVTEGVLRG